MLGLPERLWPSPIVEEIIPAVARSLRPDIPYVANSPFGGAMPSASEPICALSMTYAALTSALRRKAWVSRITTGPELSRHLSVPPVQSPLWKERVPRDRGASWDFEDVRDHYLASSMVSSWIGCSGRILISILLCRRRSPAKSRKSVMPSGGGRVRAATALWSGRCRIYCLARLGRINSTGEPKPTWYALRRPFRPVQVLFTDEGTNGLDLHVANESNVTLDLDPEVRCLRDGRQKVVSGKLGLSIEARAKCKIACTDLSAPSSTPPMPSASARRRMTSR